MADISNITIGSGNYNIKDETARQSISSINTRVTNIENEKQSEMVVIGDSYSSRTYLVSPYKLWCEIVAEILGLNLHNYADPGAGFVADGDERQSTFFTQINEANADTSFSNNKVKYVFIYGGTNDLRYSNTNVKNTFTTAFNNTMENAREKFPNAKIIFLGSDTFQSFYTKAMDDTENITELWVDYNVKNCTKFRDGSIISLDLTLFFIGMSSYFVDGVYSHPNYIAHREFATAVLNGLNSSSNAFLHMVTATPTLNSSNYEIIDALFGTKSYQLFLTDKGFEIVLQGCLHKTGSSEIVKVNYPFNIRIPYSSNLGSKFVNKNNTAYAQVYSDGHTTGKIISQQNNFYDMPYGREYIEFYELYNISGYNYRDIIIKNYINI